jgi:hypothetical protein
MRAPVKLAAFVVITTAMVSGQHARFADRSVADAADGPVAGVGHAGGWTRLNAGMGRRFLLNTPSTDR